jgi:ribonuclease HI
MSTPESYGHLILHFDGACTPKNPGGIATSAWHIEANGVELMRGWHVVKYGGPESTNNYAEYCALGLALKHIQEEEIDLSESELTIIGDSQLVIRQLTGEYACNKPMLQECLARVRKRLAELAPVKKRAQWVKRDLNTVCDDMSKLAYQRCNEFKGYRNFRGVETWLKIGE